MYQKVLYIYQVLIILMCCVNVSFHLFVYLLFIAIFLFQLSVVCNETLEFPFKKVTNIHSDPKVYRPSKIDFGLVH